MIHAPGKQLPCLRGKAGQIKDFALPLLNVVQKYLQEGQPQNTDMIHGLAAMGAIEKLLHLHKKMNRFPELAADRMERECFRFAACQAQLINYFHPF